MAETISYEPIPRDVKQEMYQQPKAAPEERSTAGGDVYAILQLLRDQGILELVKNGVGSAEKMIEIIVGVMESEQIVRTIRNLKTVTKMIRSVEPETLEKIMNSLSDGIDGTRIEKPSGFLQLIRQLSSGDRLRALEPITAILQALGRNKPETKTEERTNATSQSV